jgi:hypothetical protein
MRLFTGQPSLYQSAPTYASTDHSAALVATQVTAHIAGWRPAMRFVATPRRQHEPLACVRGTPIALQEEGAGIRQFSYAGCGTTRSHDGPTRPLSCLICPPQQPVVRPVAESWADQESTRLWEG